MAGLSEMGGDKRNIQVYWKARNFEEFREQARKNRIEEQNEEFVAASGALNQIMYKYEIESFLRTPSCSRHPVA